MTPLKGPQDPGAFYTMFINEQDFQALDFQVSHYQKEQIQQQKEFCKLVSTFIPAQVRYDVHKYPEGYDFSHAKTVFYANELTFSIRRFGKGSKTYYNIFCEDLYTLQNVSHSDRSSAEAKHHTPNAIGVLNAKKIQAWIDYYTAVHQDLKELNAVNQNMIRLFYGSIEGFKVNWNHDKKGGDIEKNGIRFKFKIYENYISETIDISNDVSNTLESFMKLSDNKFVKP